MRLQLLWALLPGVVAAQFSLDMQVGSIAVERSANPALYATLSMDSSSSAFLRSTDGGATWAPFYLTEPGAPQPKVRALLADPGSGSILYAALNLKLGGVLRSMDRGTTWTRAATGLPAGDSDVEALLAIPAGPQTPQALYAKIGTAIYKSVNRGDSWSLQSTLPAAGLFTVNLMNPAVMYLAGYRGAIYRSADEGATWIAATGFQLDFGGIPTDSIVSVVSDPMNPRTLYVTVRGGWTWVDGVSVIGLFQSKDQGATWTNLTPSGVEAYHVWVEPSGQGSLFYTVPEGSSLCRSTSGGANWSCASASSGGGPGSAELTFDPNNPGVIYAASAGVYKSTDFGASWQKLAGTVRPTLAKPAEPVQFSLPAGTGRSRQLSVQAVENSKWTMPFTASSSANWLTLSAASGTTPATLTLSASTTGLATGSYDGTVQISAPQSANGSVSIPARLTVSQPAGGPAYTLATVPGTTGLNTPTGLALDGAGNLYIGESGAHRVRKVSPAGEATTVAGTGSFGFSGDNGPATAAQLWRPEGVVLSGGNLYISDSYNDRVRKVDSGGTITTVGGKISWPRGMSVDSSGAILVASRTDNAIYTISPAGIASKRVPQGLKSPRDVVADKTGVLYVADSDNNRIQRIAADGTAATVAGTGADGFDGDGGPAVKAVLSKPASLALDSSGNLFIADTGNNLIRVVSPDGIIRALSLSGGQVNNPGDILIDASGALWIADTGNGRVVKLTPQSIGILNAASYDAGIAPGSLVAIFGTNLATDSQQAAVTPWPTTLAGATVTINGVPAPIYYASQGQINAQVPFETPIGPAQVTVGGASASFTVSAAAPGVFQGKPDRAVAQNQDYSVNGPDSPAPAGSYIVAYLTGQGLVDNPVPTGAPAPSDPLSRPLLQEIAATLGGRPCEVAFLGLTPGLIGVAQVNLKVPDDLPAGDYPLVISIGQARSKPALIAVR